MDEICAHTVACRLDQEHIVPDNWEAMRSIGAII